MDFLGNDCAKLESKKQWVEPKLIRTQKGSEGKFNKRCCKITEVGLELKRVEVLSRNSGFLWLSSTQPSDREEH